VSRTLVATVEEKVGVIGSSAGSLTAAARLLMLVARREHGSAVARCK
jgi:hypothetical protein